MEKLNLSSHDTVIHEEPTIPDYNPEKAMQARAEKEAEIKGFKIETFQDFPDYFEESDETTPDIDGVPQTLWRGERLFLGNIDELQNRELSTIGHERSANREGKVHMARDKRFASLYAVGTDGVKWYDGQLSVEEIPIGVVYKIKNAGNHLRATPTDDEPEAFGPFAGKYREFIADEVPAEDYEVSQFYIMDDFLQPNGHSRSDFRRPMEVFTVLDQEKISNIIKAIKKRMLELDKQRHATT